MSSRGRLSRPAAFALAAAVLGLCMFASGVPSPLYPLYQEAWGFSTFVLTLVFAVYCVAVLIALLLFGRLSDEIGRRPVLIATLAGLLASSALFALAQSEAWLLVARALQGLATGGALASAGAALLDFHAAGDAQHAGYVNGIVSGCGMASGALISSLLAAYVAAPRVTPYLLLLLLFGTTFVLMLRLPEPVRRAQRPRLHPARPHVPPAIRGPFLLASLGLLASWSVMGIALALGPKLADELMDTTSPVAGGATIALMVAAATLAQVAAQHVDPRRATSAGSLVLAAGVLLIAASLPTGSAAFFLAACALAGVGFGIAFLGSLRIVTAVVPEDRRAETMSAYYVVAYASNALPALAAGLLVAELDLFATFRLFAVLVAVVALAVAVAARRVRVAEPAGAGAPLR